LPWLRRLNPAKDTPLNRTVQNTLDGLLKN
jgi:hypothetical protein